MQTFRISASQLKNPKRQKLFVFCYRVLHSLLIWQESHRFTRHFFPAQKPGGFVPNIHLFMFRIGFILVLTNLPARELEGFGGFLGNWISEFLQSRMNFCISFKWLYTEPWLPPGPFREQGCAVCLDPSGISCLESLPLPGPPGKVPELWSFSGIAPAGCRQFMNPSFPKHWENSHFWVFKPLPQTGTHSC